MVEVIHNLIERDVVSDYPRVLQGMCGRVMWRRIRLNDDPRCELPRKFMNSNCIFKSFVLNGKHIYIWINFLGGDLTTWRAIVIRINWGIYCSEFGGNKKIMVTRWRRTNADFWTTWRALLIPIMNRVDNDWLAFILHFKELNHLSIQFKVIFKTNQWIKLIGIGNLSLFRWVLWHFN